MTTEMTTEMSGNLGDRDWVGTFSQGGPKAVLDEVEAMVPESWRQHISDWPIVSVAIGVAAGVFLGIRKGDEVISAASTMATAAASAHLSQVLGDNSDDDDD